MKSRTAACTSESTRLIRPSSAGQLVRSEVPADLEVHDRFAGRRLPGVQHVRDAPVGAALGADHRMDDQPDLETARGQLLGDRVHQEGHVRAVRLDHRADGRVAVPRQRRVEGAHRERRRSPAVGELEQAHDLTEQLLRVEPLHDVGGDAPDVGAGELADQVGPLRRDPFADPREQSVEEAALRGARHGRVGHAAHRVLLRAGRRYPVRSLAISSNTSTYRSQSSKVWVTESVHSSSRPGVM